MNNNPEEQSGRWPFSSRDPDTPQIPDHQLLRRIGRGSYGEIWLAQNIMGTYRAVKLVFRKQFDEDRPFEREFSGIQRFEPISRSHPGFVDILQIGKSTAAGYYYYVMEIADDLKSGNTINPDDYQPKTLRKILTTQGRVPFETCLQIGLALTDALSYLHNQGLLHRDIKPSNIVFVNDIPKIADIGLVAEVDSSRSFVGTDGFIPPDGPGTIKADIFSFGKVLYELNTGMDRQFFPELPTDVDDESEEARLGEINQVVLKACAEDPQQRYESAREMHSDLLLLQAGKSLRRLRLLERRFALLLKSVLIILTVLAVGGGVTFEINRQLRQRAELRQREVGSFLTRGAEAMDEGDLTGALPWLAEAFRIDTVTEAKEDTHRLRFGTVLDQTASIRQIWFHTGPANHAEFVSSNQVLIPAPGPDECARFYDVATGEPVSDRSFGTGVYLEKASLSPNGQFIVTSSQHTSEIRICDRSTGKTSIPPIQMGSRVEHAAFGPDSNRVIAALENGNAQILDRKTGEKLITLTGHKKRVRHAEFSQTGERAVTSSHDGEALIWSTTTGEIITRLSGHQSWVYDATFSPKGEYVATASSDQTARLWESRSGKEVFKIHHGDVVRDVEFSPDGDWLLTVGLNHRIKIWSITESQPIPKMVMPPLRDNGRPMHASFSPDGDQVLVVNWNGTSRIWRMPPDVAPPKLGNPKAHSFSSNGERQADLASRAITIRNTISGNVIDKVRPQSEPERILLNAVGDHLLTVSKRTNGVAASSHYLQLWSTKAENPVTKPFEVGNKLNHLKLSPSGERVAVVDTNTLEVWSTTKAKRLSTIPVTNGTLPKITFGPEGEWLATAIGSEARVWNSQDGYPLTDRLPHPVKVSDVTFSPNRKTLATTCEDLGLNAHAARLWNIQSSETVGTPLTHLDGVTHAAFSPDGKRVVTTGEDKTAIIWEVAKSRPVTVPMKHDHEVNYGAFARDGDWVITAGRQGIARIWDASTGDPISPPFQHGPFHLKRALLIANGQQLLTRGTHFETEEQKLFLWNLPRAGGSIEHLENLAGLLSGQTTYAQPGAMIPLTQQELKERWQDYRNTAIGPSSESSP